MISNLAILLSVLFVTVDHFAFVGSIADIEAFSQSFPDSSYALTQLAVSSYECEKLDEAVEAFRKVRRIDRYSYKVLLSSLSSVMGDCSSYSLLS